MIVDLVCLMMNLINYFRTPKKCPDCGRKITERGFEYHNRRYECDNCEWIAYSIEF